MRWYLLSLIVVLLCGCDIPSASPEKNPTFVVATDHLTESDKALFQKFAKENKVKLVVREISVDSLLLLFSDKPFETGIDVMLVHKLYDMRRVIANNLLEPVRSGHLPENAQSSKNGEFISLGVDPFICITKSGFSVNVYSDLTKLAYVFDLPAKSEAHFFAPYEERMHRAKTFERIKELKSTSIPKKSWYADSTEAILTSYSLYRTWPESDTVWAEFSDIHFPNNATSGVFHDVLTAGIIRQSSHYSIGTKFLKWMLTPEINKEFNANRGYEPVQTSNEFRVYTTPPEVLLQYHTMIERMLDEMD